METTSIRHPVTSLIVYGRVVGQPTQICSSEFQYKGNRMGVTKKKNLTEIWNSNMFSMVERISISPMLTGKIGNIKSQIKLTRTYKEHLVICHSSC